MKFNVGDRVIIRGASSSGYVKAYDPIFNCYAVELEPDNILVKYFEAHLDAIPKYSPIFDRAIGNYNYDIVMDLSSPLNKKCTCGTKVSMGTQYNIDHCSDWCDLKGKNV